MLTAISNIWRHDNILVDDDAQGPAWAYCDGWLDIQGSINQLLSSTVGGLLGTFTNGFDQIVFIVAEGQFCSNTEQGRKGNAFDWETGTEGINLIQLRDYCSCVVDRFSTVPARGHISN